MAIPWFLGRTSFRVIFNRSERREVAVNAEGLWIETPRPQQIPSVLRVKKAFGY